MSEPAVETLSPPAGTFMTQFAVYASPLDYPGEYVARAWFLVRGKPDAVPGPLVYRGWLLTEARVAIFRVGGPGLDRLPPSVADVESLVEVWL